MLTNGTSVFTRVGLVRFEDVPSPSWPCSFFPQHQASPFPVSALRLNRGKDGRRQKVALPADYLADRDDDTPPVPPLSPVQLAAFERALDAG